MNTVEWHEEMITELPLPVRQGRALSDRQVIVNVQAQMLTQCLMAVTQRAIKSEAVIRQLEAERSALFASVEGRCLDKLESVLEKYSACLTYAPTRWALLRELIRKDRVTPALSRVNHRQEGTEVRLDFHFTPKRPSHGRASSCRQSTTEHWWRESDTESIVISWDTDSKELDVWCPLDEPDAELSVQEEEGSSSGESVYFSAGSDSNDFDGDDIDGKGIDQDQEEGGPVSSRTRSRHGRLLVVVDGTSSTRQVNGEERSSGDAGGQLHACQVCQDSPFVECEELSQHGVASGHRSL